MNREFDKCPHCGGIRQAMRQIKTGSSTKSIWSCNNDSCPKKEDIRDRSLSKTEKEKIKRKLKRLLRECDDAGEQWLLDNDGIL